jgi:phage terminase large subunit-like protein
VKAHPELKRIVVAIDPAITSHAESDETGIVVIGKDDNNAYVLEDLSGRYTPNQWASIAVSACKRYGCSVVAEVNQGGDMVTQVIRNLDPSVHVKQVRATKGKYMRAEPVYALYEQGRVWHVGEFPLLENQMVAFNPDVGDSPDRVDALVWGVSELITGKRQFFAI